MLQSSVTACSLFFISLLVVNGTEGTNTSHFKNPMDPFFESGAWSDWLKVDIELTYYSSEGFKGFGPHEANIDRFISCQPGMDFY